MRRLKSWDDQESWADFFNTYWRLIYSAALKAGLDFAMVHVTPFTLKTRPSSVPRRRLI